MDNLPSGQGLEPRPRLRFRVEGQTSMLGPRWQIWDGERHFARFRNIADQTDAYNLCDALNEATRPTEPSEASGLAEEHASALLQLEAQFRAWLDKGPNEQPHYPNGMRPFSTGDLRAFVEALNALRQPTQATREAVCEHCGGNGYSGGVIPEQEELRGEYDFACEECGGSGKAREATREAPPSQEVGKLPDDLPKFCLETMRAQLATFGVSPACNVEGALEVLRSTAQGDEPQCEPTRDEVLEEAWQPIETFAEPTALSSGCGLLVAEADGTVGEAYYRNFGDEDDGWWWINTTWGDYPAPERPNPTHWMPLPEPPAALKSPVSDRSVGGRTHE